MKSVYIVLMRSQTLLSRTIRLLHEMEFSHSALSFDPEMKHMYSFVRKYPKNPFIGAFRQEYMTDWVYARSKTLPGAVVEIKVTDDQYDKIYEIVKQFNSKDYSYNFRGLIYTYFNVEQKESNKFFCSEFVYYVLNKSGVIDLGKKRQFIEPADFLSLGNGKIVFKGDLKQYSSTSICEIFSSLEVAV